jgi:4-amino-4-deoxy-L-arabinose transferase-like glycosyltransferase
MDFPYVGALKSWLYTPLFSVFGTSAAVIRIPVVVIVSIALVLVFVGVRDLTNPLVALLAFTVLCFDNSVFWLTRDDVGPSAIEFLLKCAALACAARFARSGRRQWLILLLLALGVGVFNKLNFIWIVNAAVVVSVVVAIRERRRLRAHLDLVLTWVIGLVVIYVPFGLYYVENHISTAAGPAGTFQPWTIFEHGMSWTLSGTWFYAYALAPVGWRPIVVWIVLACFAAGTLASVALPRTRSFAVAAIALVTLLIALQCLATSQATAGWHYVAVYPFVTIVASYGVWSVTRLLVRGPKALAGVLTCVAVAAVTYSGVLMIKYIDALPREPSNPAWSAAVYALSRDLQRGHDTVVTADWGIFNPLFALHPSRRYAEFAFGLEDASPGNLALQRDKLAALPGLKLVVTHAPAKLQFPNANTSLFKALGSHLRLAYRVAGADGQPVYLVYRYR